MCLSRLGQIIYGIVTFVAICLILAAMFSPGWRKLKMDVDSAVDNRKVPSNMGLFPFACTFPSNENKSSSSGTNPNDTDFCKNWWNNQPTWEKAVIAMIILALIVEVVALAWNFVTFCACCCKGFILKPLPLLAGLAALLLAICVIIFGVKNKDSIKEIHDLGDVNGQSEVGYSFYMACGALAAALANVVIGTLTVTLADHCL
ncbi:Protein CLC-1 [Aphelenchoides avenae]|nr:Protein CLC-1 [Aphelenchus avenae]